MAISFANRFNADLLDQNYERWRKDPASVDPTWSAFFEGFELGSVQPEKGAVAARNGATTTAGTDCPRETRSDGRVYCYRSLAHTLATLAPRAHARPDDHRRL